MGITSLVPSECIEQSILLIREQKVMLDRDLAKLYGVQTEVLVQAVKRNPKRFPKDFFFQLHAREFKNWRSQIVISNFSDKMGLRRAPYAFTEQGVVMLSSVLRSDRAIEVNIAIMRAFVKLREMVLSHKELAQKLAELEQKYDGQFKAVFEVIHELIKPPAAEPEPKERIGFRLE